MFAQVDLSSFVILYSDVINKNYTWGWDIIQSMYIIYIQGLESVDGTGQQR